MKVNTVLISLDRLRELESAEKEIKEPIGKIIKIKVDGWNYTVDTNDECAEKLANDLKETQMYLKGTEDKFSKEQREKERLIEDLKKMNYWEFRKWKKEENEKDKDLRPTM